MKQQNIDQSKGQILKQDRTYQNKHNSFGRKLLLSHIFSYFRNIKKNVKNTNGEEAEKQLKIQYLPDISQQYRTEKMKKKFKALLAEAQGQSLSPWKIYRLIYSALKCQIITLFILSIFFFLSFLAIAILLYFAFDLLKKQQSKNKAVIFSVLAALTGYIYVVLKHNYLIKCTNIVCYVREVMISLIFQKLLTLSQFTINKEEAGKLSNMISNDFSLMEMKVFWFFGLLASPFIFLSSIGVMIWWLGIQGLICFGVLFISIPLQIYLGFVIGQKIEKINTYKDTRVELTSDLITSIKYIKTYVWEEVFLQKIDKQRVQEIRGLKILGAIRSLLMAIGSSMIHIGAFLSFYAQYKSGQLSEPVLFSANMVMLFLQDFSYYVAYGLDSVFEVNVIFMRFIAIYQIENQQMICIEQPSKTGLKTHQKQKNDCAVVFQDFNGFWSYNERQKEPTIKNINLQLKKSVFYGLCGKVGSGKSTLLEAIINQLPYYSGKIQVNGKVAYCDQQQTIFSGSIKSNIIFGRELDNQKYERALEFSVLNEDLKLLEFGDQTIVGEKGITLSGGQKARVSLARTLYSEADIYIFDDPLSAVNSKVAKQIFNGIKTQLEGKTIILNTHITHFLDQCDEIIFLEEGRIEKKIQCHKISKENLFHLIKDQIKQISDANPQQQEKMNESEMAIPTQFEEKDVQFGFKTYIKYLFYESKWKYLFSQLLFIIAHLSLSIYFQLFSYYDEQIKDKQLFKSNEAYWGVLGCLVGCYLILMFISYYYLNIVFANKNKMISDKMAEAVSRSKTSYFDSHNSGSLINRFSNDIGVLDHSLVYSFEENNSIAGTIIISLANIVYQNLYFLILLAIQIIIFVLVYRYFLQMIVKAKQLDLRLKNPIFKKLAQLTQGVKVIKTFANQGQFIQQTTDIIDDSTKANIFVWYINDVFTFIMQSCEWTIISIALIAGVYIIQDPSKYAVVALFLFQMPIDTNLFVSNLMNVQISMISVSRCLDLIEIPPEKPNSTQFDAQYAKKNHCSAPVSQRTLLDQTQSLCFKNFQMRYREQLPIVLKGLDFRIIAGEKVGIVGRTGAGKSSLIHALLRMAEPQQQSEYFIHGVNALQLGLHTLRKWFTVISQSPFIFDGTLRKNLDNAHQFKDEQIWNALEAVHLSHYVQSLPQKLHTEISNSKVIFSVGEKQLFCLARALLSSKDTIVLLDQATSNLDKKTDQLIQQTIKKNFSDRTVITIAHRLNTVADYDKIFVFEDGLIKEADHPYRLLQKESLFRQMAKVTPMHFEEILKASQNSFRKRRK